MLSAPRAMGADEARATIAAIREHLDDARTLLLDLYERRGWESLGYASMEACAEAEFGWRRRYAYYLLEAARTERELCTIVHAAPLPPMREYHLRLIAEMPREERRAIAEQLASGELSPRRLHGLAKEKRDGQPRPALTLPPPALPIPTPEHVRIERADAAALPWVAGTVDLWVTSPPYCLGITEAGYIDYTDYPTYLRLASAWAAEMHRVGAPRARLALNVALDITKPRQPLSADWVQVLRSVGWQYRTTILWKEGNISRGTARGSVDSPAAPNAICPAEVVLVFHKGDWNLARADRRSAWGRSDLTRQEWLDWTMASWSFAGEKSRSVGGHAAAFPEELARRCVKLFSFPGATVGDPFVGSGTTAAVGAQLGRRVLASDVNQAFVDLARARVASVLLS